MTTPTIAPADFIAGMAKGLAVLESFDTERQRLNATLAAERAGITRAAARRHLLTLAYLGYLESDGQYFWLSPKVLRFSGSYLASARLPRVVQPTLNRLAAQTLLPFSVVVLEGPQVVIVARSTAHAEGERILAYGLHLGSRLPAHATSTGRVLLAALPKEELREWLRTHSLPRLTAYTQTEAPTLRKTLTLGACRRLLRGQRRTRNRRTRPGRAAARPAGPHGGGAERGDLTAAAAGRPAGKRPAAGAAGCRPGAAASALSPFFESN